MSDSDETDEVCVDLVRVMEDAGIPPWLDPVKQTPATGFVDDVMDMFGELCRTVRNPGVVYQLDPDSVMRGMWSGIERLAERRDLPLPDEASCRRRICAQLLRSFTDRIADGVEGPCAEMGGCHCAEVQVINCCGCIELQQLVGTKVCLPLPSGC